MTLWLMIAGMVAVTYGVRLSVIALLGDAALPSELQRALRYVPPAALAAIAIPALIMPEGRLEFSAGNTRLIAGVIAALVAWRTRSTLLPIGVGMVALWLLNALIG